MKKRIFWLLISAVCLCLALTSCFDDEPQESPIGEKGLKYELSNDGKSYAVIGIGENKDKELSIPSKNKGLPVKSIASNAFYGSDVTSVVIPSSVTEISDHAFISCTTLESITFPNGLVRIGNNAFYGCKNLKEIELPASLKSLEKLAFYDCDSLVSVEVPMGITEISQDLFSECDNLETVVLPSSVTIVGYAAFNHTPKLKSVDLGGCVEAIGESAFGGCVSLKEIELPKTVKTIGDSAFNGSGLTQIKIPKSVTEMGYWAFWNCNSLNTIYCGAESKPSGWNDEWKEYSAEAIWGYPIE